MKKQKVTYKTSEGLVFNTLIEADNEAQAINIMKSQYAFDRIEILKVRPSVKQSYKRVCNYKVKK